MVLIVRVIVALFGCKVRSLIGRWRWQFIISGLTCLKKFAKLVQQVSLKRQSFTKLPLQLFDKNEDARNNKRNEDHS